MAILNSQACQDVYSNYQTYFSSRICYYPETVPSKLHKSWVKLELKSAALSSITNYCGELDSIRCEEVYYHDKILRL